MNSKQPLVSVIVPVYNRLDFLPQLTETIFKQDYNNFEVIIVDDGSTDGSYEWLEEKKDSFSKPIRLLRQANAGHYAARNHALDYAQGEFIAFQDSDDEWPDYHISSLVSRMIENPDLDWLFGRIRRIDHDTREVVQESNWVMTDGTRHPFLLLNTENRPEGLKVFDDPRIGKAAIMHRVPGSTQSALIRRTVFRHIRFDKSYRTAYDQFFAVKVVLLGFKFGYVDEVHQIYHVHDSHISLVAGGNSAKRETSGKTHIRGYSGMLNYQLTSEQRDALNARIAREWAWNISVAQREQGKHRSSMLSMLNAFKLKPSSFKYIKSLLSATFRFAINPLSK